MVLPTLSSKGVDEFHDVEATSQAPQIAFQSEETIDHLALSNNIEIAPSGQEHQAMRQWFHIAAQFALGTAGSLSYCP